MKRTICLVLALTVLGGLPLFAAGTPAGTQIKNQATARYKDINGNIQISTSNEVITIVKPIYGVTVTPNGTTAAPVTQTVALGSTVYLPYVLANVGNGPDSFNLTTALDGSNSFTPTNIKIYLDTNGNGVADAGDPEITNTGTVPADGIGSLIVAYDVPSTATAGNFALVNLVATSTGDASKTDTNNWNKSTIVNDAVLTTTKSATPSSVLPNGVITYSIQGTNIGTKPSTALTLANIDTNGDGNPDTASGMLISDVLPVGLRVSGTPATDFGSIAPVSAFKLYGYTDGLWSTDGALASRTVDKVGLYIPGTLGNGQEYLLTWKATVKADAAAGPLANTAYTHWADTSGTDKNAPSNTSYTTVSASYAVKIGPAGDPEASGTADITTLANQSAGSTALFTNTVKNNGTDTDIFNISYTWTANQIGGASIGLYMADGMTPLGDTNSDGIPDTGMIPKGGTASIVVKLLIPGTGAADLLLHDITVQALSTKNAAMSDTTIDRIDKITAGATDLYNNNASAQTAYGQHTAPGTSLSFPLIVSNTNNFAETYALSQTDTLLPGWTVQFYPDSDNDKVADPSSSPVSSSTLVPAGGHYTFIALVSIPAGQTPLSGDPWASGNSQKLTFKAVGAVSGQNDAQRDWAEVDSKFSFIFDPDNSGIATAGGTVFYTHVLKNTGNAAQTFNLSFDTVPRAGWIYSLSKDGTAFSVSLSGITLAVGAQQTITVKVYVPSSEAVGAMDTGGVRVSNDALPPISLRRSDTTTIVGGNLKLVKSVASFDVVDSPATPDQPGDELEYTIAYQNLSTQDMTDVYVYDSIPSYCGYKISSASGTTEYSSDHGATWTCSPASGAGGAPAGYDYTVTNVRWKLSTLAGGASGSVLFRVRIK